ncbi:hypothetical protein EVA_13394 [gut metagenome]|uniref:Uncharacterized protein n=1 Tax=gut metagenome TaxID=749906 RepID=J9GGK6_9ZZZZ
MHNVFDLRQLVHEVHLVVQTSCCVDDDNVGIVCLSRTDSIVGYTCWVAAHLLFDDGYTDTFAPDTELFYCCCSEGIGCAKIHFLAGLLKLVGQFANSGSLTDTVDTYDHDDVRLLVFWNIEAFAVVIAATGQECGNFFLKNIVQVTGADVFVACYSFFNPMDDLQSCVYTDVRGDEYIFQFVENFVVYLGFAGNSFGNFTENTGFGLFQTCVQYFFFSFFEKILKNPMS